MLHDRTQTWAIIFHFRRVSEVNNGPITKLFLCNKRGSLGVEWYIKIKPRHPSKSAFQKNQMCLNKMFGICLRNILCFSVINGKCSTVLGMGIICFNNHLFCLYCLAKSRKTISSHKTQRESWITHEHLFQLLMFCQNVRIAFHEWLYKHCTALAPVWGKTRKRRCWRRVSLKIKEICLHNRTGKKATSKPSDFF